LKFEGFEEIKQFVMVIFLRSAQSVYFNQYSALCASINFWFWTMPNHMLKKHSKNQGSPMWCPQAPGRPQGPSRLSAGIGVAKRHGHQISSICRFALWEVLSETKYCCSLKVKIFGPKKIFRLGMLLPAGLL